MSINRLLIANRGEIAVRVIRAAQELGMSAIVTHSQADADSLAVRLADHAIEIGPPPASKSYLNIEAIMGAAKETKADAVHPGYGFLAENADFADAVESAGLNFVGPEGKTIRLMGDKIAAREVATKAGVPTVSGSSDRIDSLDEACELATQIGFPVLIKAAAGGGGRGIRRPIWNYSGSLCLRPVKKPKRLLETAGSMWKNSFAMRVTLRFRF